MPVLVDTDESVEVAFADEMKRSCDTRTREVISVGRRGTTLSEEAAACYPAWFADFFECAVAK